MPSPARIINDYRPTSLTPVVCAYNLMFDLASLMQWLQSHFAVRCMAKSTANAYTMDLFANRSQMESHAKPLLRLWDVYFLE